MTLIIKLHDGETIEATVTSFDAEALAITLNNRETMAVAIGNVVLNKTAIKVVSEKVVI